MENLIAAGAAGGGSAATFAPLDPYAAQPKMSYSEVGLCTLNHVDP
jgi:hypothetical protein